MIPKPSIRGLGGRRGTSASVGSAMDFVTMPVIVPLAGVGVGVGVYYLYRGWANPSAKTDVAPISVDESPTGTLRTGHPQKVETLTSMDFVETEESKVVDSMAPTRKRL
jgi:hypothetical protein